MNEHTTATPQGERPFIKAENISFRTVIGAPYTNVSMTVPRNTFAMIYGEHGSGKTPLLLTLAGRMAPTKGFLEVGGYRSPKERNKIAKITGMGIFRGLNDLEENLTCESILRAELELYGKPARKEFLTEYFEKWNLSHIQDLHVRDLAHLDLAMFGIALGMANDPQMLVVDDLEEQLTLEQIHQVIHVLRGIAHDQHKVVVAGCTEDSLAPAADLSFHLRQGD